VSGKTITFYIITSVITLLITLVLGETGIRLFTESRTIPSPPTPSTFNPYTENKYIINSRPYIYYHIPRSIYFQQLALYTNEYQN
jgi:hypothetical protein